MKEKIIYDLTESNKNIIVTGDLGTGKTISIFFPLMNKIVESNESFIVLDPKEEYIGKYYNEVKSKGYNIIVVNLKDLNKSDGWNIFEYPYKLYKNGDEDRALNYLDQIGSEMFYENSEVDPFWWESAADLFTGVTLALFEDAKEEEINLSSINIMFDGLSKKFGNETYLSVYFKLKNTSSQSYIYASNTIFAPKETTLGILSVARQKLRVYVSRKTLNKLLNKTTFKYEDLNTKKTAIFVITKEDNRNINSLATIFIKQLFSYLVDNRSNTKFNFMLDNFDTLKNITGISEMMSAGASNNMKFVLATRSREYLEKQYGNYLFKLSNTLSLTEKKIESIISNEAKTIENTIDANAFTVSEVEYPSVESAEIKIFPLEEYVRAKKRDDLFKEMEEQDDLPKNEEKSDIDEVIAKLDKEIKRLEEENLK